jgi:hypothetical protein
MRLWYQDASIVAWLCALGPYTIPDSEVPVRLAEAAVESGSESFNASFLNILGAALYRAGRYDDAIRRLEEGMQGWGGVDLPDDWAFLAMAHHRLGHREAARRWLGRLRERPRDASPNSLYSDLEHRLLQSEAEAVILYDPVFPDDPFAR